MIGDLGTSTLARARTPWDNKHLCQVEPPLPQSFPTSGSHFVNQIAASASEWPPQLEAATSGSSSPRSTLNKRRQHDWLSEWWGRKRSNWLSQYHCGGSGPSPRPPPTLKSGFGLCLRVRSPNMLTADSVWVATPAWTQRFKSAGSLLKGIANHFKDLCRSRIRDGFKPPLEYTQATAADLNSHRLQCTDAQIDTAVKRAGGAEETQNINS